ncbi:GtrA family protein [Macrococcus animalis]|uniref:GtrA family protein n=1 Tax=Macrococcus animalis TaxID=3395467 RepID=UPI0039BFA442
MVNIIPHKICRFAKFVVVGVFNTFNYYLVYLLLLKVFHLNYLTSHISGFLFSFVISYFLNCYYVYKVKPTWKKFLTFPLTQVVNMGLQTFLLYAFVEWINLSKELAPFPALIVTIPITYIMTSYILTKEKS